MRLSTREFIRSVRLRKNRKFTPRLPFDLAVAVDVVFARLKSFLTFNLLLISTSEQQISPPNLRNVGKASEQNLFWMWKIEHFMGNFHVVVPRK